MDALRKLISAKWINPPTDPTTSFAGKIVIITGANTGLGYEAAVKFVNLGVSHLILGVRNEFKGEAAKKSLESRCPAYTGQIEVWPLEMSSYASIHGFVEKCNKLTTIDNVILNAGVMMKEFDPSEHGWETTLQVNTLSTTLLALLLLPKLKEMREKLNSRPVLEFVTSDLYRNVVMPGESDPEPDGMELYYFSDTPMQSYNTEIGFKGREQYARSKFFLQCAIKQIARLAGKPAVIHAIVICVSPGVCSTELGRAYAPTGIKGLLFSLVKALFFRTSEQGARSLVSGALTTIGEIELKGTQGGYWRNDKWAE